MENALTASGFKCVQAWADLLERYGELAGMCGAKSVQAVVEAMEADVLAGKVPDDEKIKSTLSVLRRNEDFNIWARVANLSCNLPRPAFPSAEESSRETITVARRSRALWSAVLDIMERNPEAAEQWAAGSVSDATLSRLLSGVAPDAPVHLVLRLVSVISTMIRGSDNSSSESSRSGICSLQSAQGVWKRKSSYPSRANKTHVYGAVLPVRYGRANIAVGVVLVCIAASLLKLAKRNASG